MRHARCNQPTADPSSSRERARSECNQQPIIHVGISQIVRFASWTSAGSLLHAAQSLGGIDCVVQEHGNRHRTYAIGHWRYGTCLFTHGGIVNVAH